VFILPISHEQSTVRRWPVFTIGIIAINVVVLVVSMIVGAPAEKRFNDAVHTASAFIAQHPRIAGSAPGCVIAERPPETGKLPLGRTLTAAQDEKDLDELRDLCAEVFAARDATINYRYGYSAAKPSALTLVASMFMHGGILHLVFNMWFFWLCGCNLEDRWGRVVFPIFYLLAGAAGTLTHGYLTHSPKIPLVGASGAIAGAMGAFLAVLGATRIRFAYAYFIIRPKWGIFEAAAYWMLPLWLTSEVVEALLAPEGGTAHWAHVGGFVFGLVVAGLMKVSGLDAKLDAVVDKSVTRLQDPRLTAASALIDQRRYPEAIAALDVLVREKPGDVDVLVELLRALTGARDLPRRLATSVHLMTAYLNRDFTEAAADVYLELRLHDLESQLSREDAARLGEAFARRQKNEMALYGLRQAQRDGLIDILAVRSASAEGTVLLRLGKLHEAQRVFASCKESPFLTVEMEQKIDAQLAALSPNGKPPELPVDRPFPRA
jgi:membrane associated rhomboid family serine protease